MVDLPLQVVGCVTVRSALKIVGLESGVSGTEHGLKLRCSELVELVEVGEVGCEWPSVVRTSTGGANFGREPAPKRKSPLNERALAPGSPA